MIKNALLISFFFLNLSLLAQKDLYETNEESPTFLNYLKRFEYDSALSLVRAFDLDIRIEAQSLVNVLKNAGQSKLEISLKSKIHDSLASCFNKLSFAYNNLYTKPYDSNSFKIFNEVYQYAQEVGDDQLEKTALIAILEVYNYELLQTNDEGLKYLEALKRKKTGVVDEYHYRMNLLHFSLRDIFLDIKVDDSFFNEFDILMEYFPKSHKFWPNYYSSKGVYQETKKRFEAAEALHKKAIQSIGEEKFLKYIKFRSLIRLAEINKTQGRYGRAIKYIDSAVVFKDLADSIRSNYYLNYYYSSVFAKIGNYRLAYEKMRASDSLKSYIDYERNSSEISGLNIKYQTAEKEKQILIEKQRATTNRNWLIAAALALLLGAGIAILLQKNTAKKRQLAEQAALLEQQKVQTLLKEQELVSIDAMIEGQEKERQKVANELHDDLGSLMATVKLHFDNVKVDQKDPALKHAQKLLDEAYRKIRSMAHAKNSGVMADQGLLPAVKKMAKTVSETNALDIGVEDFGLGERMENSLELTIFRIVQELVANVIKHSEATKATIQFTQHEDRLNIIVEDNGKGFDMSAVNRETSGMGLGTIEKRIEHLEGSFTVDSVLGRGTSILIDIPV